VRDLLRVSFPLDRVQAGQMARNRLAAVSASGDSAAVFERRPDETYLFHHPNPSLAFRSNRIPRILAVEDDRALVWGKVEMQEQGLYMIEPGATRLLARLDRLEGVWVRGAGGVEDVGVYGHNVDDPDGNQRFVVGTASLLLPNGSAIAEPGFAVLIRGDRFWVRGSLAGSVPLSLPFRSSEVETCLPVRLLGVDVFILQRSGRWSIRRESDEARIRGQVKDAWTSPSGRSFAMLVELSRDVLDPATLPARRRLIVTGLDRKIRVMARGRFDVKDLHWSDDDQHLAACLTQYELVPGADEVVTSTSVIVTTKNEEVVEVGTGEVSEPAVDGSGRIVAYVRQPENEQPRVVIDRVESDPYGHIWPPCLMHREQVVGYATLSEQGVQHVQEERFPA
jgi:hypothetical protein